MSDFQDKLDALKLRRAEAARLAREKQDAAEGDTVLALLEDGENGFVRFLSVPADLPGFVVFKPASKVQIARYREIMWRNSNEKGSVDAKAKAGGQLARTCKIYPDDAKYDAMVEACGMIPDAVARAILEKAEGGVEREVKE